MRMVPHQNALRAHARQGAAVDANATARDTCRQVAGTSALCGFSLIEMLVALVILSLSLGVLYQAAMGATRNVRVASEYTDAVMIAETKLNEYRYIAEENFEAQGTFGDFSWRVSSWPVLLPEGANEDSGLRFGAPLQYLQATVSWPARSGDREIDLLTIVPLAEPEL